MARNNLGVMIGAGEGGAVDDAAAGNLSSKGDRGRGRGRWGCWATEEVAWTTGCASDIPDDGRGISQSMGNIEAGAMNKHLPSTGAW